MESYLNILENTPLFRQISKEDITSVLSCLSVKEVHYSKEEFIFHQGSPISSIGLVVAGSVHIIQEDFWGNRTILTNILPTQIFGETYASMPGLPLEVSAVAATNSTVLFLDFNKLFTTCKNTCSFHQTLIHNFITVLAFKNLQLTKKIEHLSKKTTKEKLLSFLSAESLKANSSSFTIEYNRQQLADYLSLDRSAMSNELSKLRDQGIIIYQKNSFQLLKPI